MRSSRLEKRGMSPLLGRNGPLFGRWCSVMRGAWSLKIAPDPEPGQGHYYRSDHFSLARVGIPAFSISAGYRLCWKTGRFRRKRTSRSSTQKHYHQPSDEYHEDWDFREHGTDGRIWSHAGTRFRKSAVAADLEQRRRVLEARRQKSGVARPQDAFNRSFSRLSRASPQLRWSQHPHRQVPPQTNSLAAGLTSPSPAGIRSEATDSETRARPGDEKLAGPVQMNAAGGRGGQRTVPQLHEINAARLPARACSKTSSGSRSMNRSRIEPMPMMPSRCPGRHSRRTAL